MGQEEDRYEETMYKQLHGERNNVRGLLERGLKLENREGMLA